MTIRERPTVCVHDRLGRSCPECDAQEEIEDLRAALAQEEELRKIAEQTVGTLALALELALCRIRKLQGGNHANGEDRKSDVA